jgi:chitinase
MIRGPRTWIAFLSVLSAITMGACKKNLRPETSKIASVDSAKYMIRSLGSGKCLDVPNASDENGLQLQQWDCYNSDPQVFIITGVGNSFYKIASAKTGKVLDIRDASTSNGAALQQWDGYNSIQQQFSLEDRGEGRFFIRSRVSGLVLDVTDRNTSNGAKIQQWTAGTGDNQIFTLIRVGNTENNASGFRSIISEAMFNSMFPERNGFYSYSGIADAVDGYEGFAKTGDVASRKLEVAAFLANIAHESGHLKYIEEINKENWPRYCDSNNKVSPCTPGKQYYGRGPIQISWNYNYAEAGRTIGKDLLNDPDMVARDSKVAWQTAIWFWMTQKGAGTMTPHDAITSARSFGETIRSINGALECGGGNPSQVQSRIANYLNFTRILGVEVAGTASSC